MQMRSVGILRILWVKRVCSWAKWFIPPRFISVSMDLIPLDGMQGYPSPGGERQCATVPHVMGSEQVNYGYKDLRERFAFRPS